MKKFGFTLAEVLITLGVIGVVAAMTLPTLINKTKGAQYRAKFKKSVSVLNQAVKLNQAKYDFNFADANSECVDDTPRTKQYPESTKTFCAILNGSVKEPTIFDATFYSNNEKGHNEAKQNENIEKQYFVDYQTISSTQTLVYTLTDGTSVGLPPVDENITGNCTLPTGKSLTERLKESYGYDNHEYSFSITCTGFIDVNGLDNGPNKEVACADGNTKYDPENPCIVDDKTIGDTFPIVFYDSTVAPATNAAASILMNTK